MILIHFIISSATLHANISSMSTFFLLFHLCPGHDITYGGFIMTFSTLKLGVPSLIVRHLRYNHFLWFPHPRPWLLSLSILGSTMSRIPSSTDSLAPFFNIRGILSLELYWSTTFQTCLRLSSNLIVSFLNINSNLVHLQLVYMT